MESITPEELANKELSKLKKRNGEIKFPIDPFAILKSNNINIVFKDFENLAGIIISDSDGSTIVGIKKTDKIKRQRFTAAHEYCHFIKDLKNLKLDKKNNGKIIKCVENSNSEIEKFAEKFAGYLLMPTYELKKECDLYKDSNGYVNFDDILKISEHFGTSFSACVFSIAYRFKMISGEIDSNKLKQRVLDYDPDEKSKKLLKTTIDPILLAEVINSISYSMLNLNSIVGEKFLQDYIFYDNKIEKINISKSDVYFILAKTNYSGLDRQQNNMEDDATSMTIGNLLMQKYVLTTNDKPTIKSIKKLHNLLFSQARYHDEFDSYRNCDAIISCGKIQPIKYELIYDEIDKLENEFSNFINKKDNIAIVDYIKMVAYFSYKLTIIHPFADGNGRISRAFINWMLHIKGIIPMHLDNDCREEYYKAIQQIDVNNNYEWFMVFIEKRIITTMIETTKTVI